MECLERRLELARDGLARLALRPGSERGEGMVVVDAGGVTTVAVDTAVVPTYLTAEATLDFPSISNVTCSAEINIPPAGAVPGDAVAPNWPATLQAGCWE